MIKLNNDDDDDGVVFVCTGKMSRQILGNVVDLRFSFWFVCKRAMFVDLV